MKGKYVNAIAAISFISFVLIVSEVSEYLIGIVPAPHTAWFDLYTIVHAVSVGGTVVFILVFTQNNVKLRRYAFFALLTLIFVWEAIENTVLRETALAGQESLGNIGTDIFIGIVSIGIVYSARNWSFDLELIRKKFNQKYKYKIKPV